MRRIQFGFIDISQSIRVFSVCLMFVLSSPCLCHSAVNDWVEGSQDAADGASRDYYNRAAMLEWQNYLGDYRDAVDVAQGTQPYATATIEDTDSARYIDWDVTSLVQEWLEQTYQNQGFFIKALSGGGPVNFRSKEFSDSSQHPQLVLQTSEGMLSITPEADTYLEPSTYRSLGDSERLTLRLDGSNILLRFDLSSISEELVISSATLKLFTYAQYGGTALVAGVFRSAQGDSIGPNAPTMGIAADYDYDQNISQHPEIIFATGFEADNWQDEWSSTYGTIEVIDNDEELEFSPLQTRALKVLMPEGERSSMRVTYDFLEKIGAEPEEVYFRYYLRFADDWNQTVYSGKLPGISGTYGQAGWGGGVNLMGPMAGRPGEPIT